jgi:hypothetical protein
MKNERNRPTAHSTGYGTKFKRLASPKEFDLIISSSELYFFLLLLWCCRLRVTPVVRCSCLFNYLSFFLYYSSTTMINETNETVSIL